MLHEMPCSLKALWMPKDRRDRKWDWYVFDSVLFCFLTLVMCCCFLTLTDPLRIQPWSQDRRNQTKSNRESEMSMESIQKRTGKK